MTQGAVLVRSRALIERTRLLGPAFVAAVAYVDPGNVATNTAAGARYDYRLLWVLVAATAMACLVQYLSAKVGWLTGQSLPALVAARNSRGLRLSYWVQAEVVAVATDLAEIVGGAVALGLLFDLPLPIGAGVTAATSTALLFVPDRWSQRTFERVITGLLAVVAVGFGVSLLVTPPDLGAAAHGLVPSLAGADSALLAVGMLGATVMPHAVYLHSALVRDRHGAADPQRASALLRAIRWDVGLAMVFAGGVNLGMLLLAASALGPSDGASLATAHAGLGRDVGSGVALLFAIALLASGLASTSVGGYAGAVIMDGLLRRRIPLVWRRLLTALPALGLLTAGLEPTRLLILSQVVLSFGLPFALLPLLRISADRQLMRLAPTRPATLALAWLVVAVVIVFNVGLLVLTLGQAGPG